MIVHKKKSSASGSSSSREHKRGSGSSDSRDVWMESAMFGAFQQSEVHTCMMGSNSSKAEIESLVRDVRLLLVDSAYARWAAFCNSDNNNPIIPLVV